MDVEADATNARWEAYVESSERMREKGSSQRTGNIPDFQSLAALKKTLANRAFLAVRYQADTQALHGQPVQNDLWVFVDQQTAEVIDTYTEVQVVADY